MQGGVTKALSGTTLADLVEFADQHRPAASAATGSRGKRAVAGAA